MSMTPSADNLEVRKALALKKCQSSINWLRRYKNRSRNLFQFSQVAIIVFSTLTPVLILVTDLPKWAQALPAALAAIAATLSNVFHWQENWVRRASTLQAMEAEQLKYETKTSSAYELDLDEQQALTNFVEQITILNLTEVSNWGITQNLKQEKGVQK